METNVTTSPQHKLSKTLATADSEPVRSLSVLVPGNINEKQSEDEYQLLAGSQNGILSIFDLSVNTNECLQMTPNDGSRPHSMTALLAIPENKSFHYAAASRDANIRIFSKDHTLLKTLTGHEKPVTSLSWLCIGTKHQYLISGSWDGTAKLWELNTGTCVATLPDHENTVTVMGLKNNGENFGKVVTASAGIAEGGMIKNHKIRIWDIQVVSEFSLNCKLAHIPTDNHSGPIRGLSHDKNAAHMFTSCSNDGTVKLRDVDTGECTLTITADEPGSFQPPILLDVMTHSTSSETGPTIAIAAEDGGLLLWSEESGSIQRIDHPGCVWKVMFLPNGDICTACQDGFVRIFTSDSSRFADPMEIKALQESSNVNQRKASSGPSADEIAKLPKWEMRSIQTGRSEGQIQVFSRDGKAIAAQWNDASRTWIEVGEVMGSNPNAGSINGENFDHVLPIEVDIPGGGVQKLQIGYNNGENPFVTAQQFIDDHMLDQNYLSQIADYIRQRVGDSAVTLGGNKTAPSSAQSTTTGPTFEMSPPPKQQKIYEHLPMKGYLKFDVPNMNNVVTKISNKITELNMEKDGNVDLTLLPTLKNTLMATSRYHSSIIEVNELVMLKNYLADMDIDAIYPVLDLLRITVLHPDAGSLQKERLWHQLIEMILEKISSVTPEIVSENKLVAAVPMLSFRIFANCFYGGKGSTNAVSSNLLMIIAHAEKFSQFSPSNKNLRLSISTLILNIASFLKSSISSISPVLLKQYISQILVLIQKILNASTYENDALIRTLLGLGTILLIDGSKEVAIEINMPNTIKSLSGLNGKGPAIIEEVSSLM